MAFSRRSHSGLGSVAIVVAIVLIAGACSGDSDSTSGSTSDPAAAAAAALDSTRSTTTTTTTAPHDADADAEHPEDEQTEPLDPTTIRGAIINQYSLAVGDCFDRLNDLQNGLPIVITTKFGCFTPHEFQVFHRLEFPAGSPAIYPGDKVMQDFALDSCYREFESWVGAKYEVSELDIEVLTPTQDNFEDAVARYRGIHCFVHRIDGEPLIASTRRSGI